MSRRRRSGTTERVDVSSLGDRELLRRARAGDARSLDTLLERYRNVARAKAATYYLRGSAPEDLSQEAMIGLLKAIKTFDLDKDIPFSAFARLCILGQIRTAVKTARRRKHEVLTRAVSLDQSMPSHFHDEDADDVFSAFASGDPDPAEVAVAAEEIEALQRFMAASFTELERVSIDMYMEGRSYDEIAEALGRHAKCINNALQRVRMKIHQHLETRVDDSDAARVGVSV